MAFCATRTRCTSSAAAQPRHLLRARSRRRRVTETSNPKTKTIKIRGMEFAFRAGQAGHGVISSRVERCLHRPRDTPHQPERSMSASFACTKTDGRTNPCPNAVHTEPFPTSVLKTWTQLLWNDSCSKLRYLQVAFGGGYLTSLLVLDVGD